MEDAQEGPIPMESTKIKGETRRYLFTYDLLENPREDGIVGAFKFLGFFNDEEELDELYNSVLPTNRQTQIAWAEPGVWEIMRHAHTNLEGPVSLVDNKNNEVGNDTEGAKRVRITDPAAEEELMDRFSIDAYKAKLKEAAVQKKKVELRQTALKELQEQFDDSNSLAYYSRLQYQRLAQKDHIEDLEEKLKNAVKVHSDSVKELRELTRRFPHFKNQWQTEIRRVQKLMSGKDSKFEIKENENDVEEWDYSPEPVKQEQDEFFEGVLLEDKGKEDDEKFYTDEMEKEEKKRLYGEIKKTAEELHEARLTIARQQEEIAATFLPDAQNKGKKKNKKIKKKKEKKPPKKK